MVEQFSQNGQTSDAVTNQTGQHTEYLLASAPIDYATRSIAYATAVELVRLGIFGTSDRPIMTWYVICRAANRHVRGRINRLVGNAFISSQVAPSTRSLVGAIESSCIFGYAFGREIAALVGNRGREVGRAAWLCTLARLTASLLDVLLDHAPTKFPMAEQIGRLAISRLFDHRSNPPSVGLNDDPLLNLLARIVKATIPRLDRRLQVHPELADELRQTLLRLLDLEHFDRSMIRRINAPTVYAHLRERGSLPFWAEVLICLSSQDQRRDECIEEWRDHAIAFGEIFWIVDDIVDVMRDLRSQRWNRFLVELASSTQAGPGPLNPIPVDSTAAVYSDIMNRGFPERAAREIHNRMAALRDTYRVRGLRWDSMNRLLECYITQHFYPEMFASIRAHHFA